MNRINRFVNYFVFGFAAIFIAYAIASVVDSVGRYQLDAVYTCAIEFTEAEHRTYCRNELDGFGHLTVIGGQS